MFSSNSTGDEYYDNYYYDDNVSDAVVISANRSDYYDYYRYYGYYDNYSYYEDYIPTQTASTVVLVIFGFVLLVGIVGNILVMIIIVAVKSMRTTVNKCLFSLALADLVILTMLPISPIQEEFADTLQLGTELCEFLIFYDRGAVYCSVLSFFYVTIDRYFALCYPLRSRALWTGRKTYAILAAIWIISLLSSYPNLYNAKYEEYFYDNKSHYFCYLNTLDNKWMEWYDTFFNVLTVFIPTPVLLFLYGRMMHKIRNSVPKLSSGSKGNDVSGWRGRGQVVFSLLAVVIVYIVSYLPFACLTLFHYHFPTVFSWWPYNESIFRITWIARILIYVNSAANPVIYFSLSSNFRKGFLQVFCCCGRNKSQKHSEETQRSSL